MCIASTVIDYKLLNINIHIYTLTLWTVVRSLEMGEPQPVTLSLVLSISEF